MSSVLAIANQKGGVGKTTTAINLGAALAALERRVLLVDCDPQGNATRGLGQEASAPNLYHVLTGQAEAGAAIRSSGFPNLDLLPADRDLVGVEVEFVGLEGWQARLAEALAPVASGYDWVLLDCPPSLGHLTVLALVAAGGVLVPLQCEYFALEGVSELVSTIARVGASLNPGLEISGILLTMYDDRMNLTKDVERELRSHFGATALETVVPRNVRLAEAPSHGVPIFGYDIRSRGAEAYLALARELRKGRVMTDKRRGLGRGLSALLPAEEGVRTLPIDKLRPGRQQPRSAFDDAGLDDLAASIRAQGVIQPLIVTPAGAGSYTIVAGERRWRAAQRAGLKAVPVVVREVRDDRHQLELALVENLQRADLNPMEEAEAFHSLQESFGLSHEAIAERVGRARPAVSNTLRLLKLPDAVQEMLRSGQLTAGQARPLLALDDPAAILAMAERAVREGLSARALEGLAAAATPRPASRKKKKSKPDEPHAAAAAERLTQLLQTKVEIDRRRKGGQIRIQFHSEEELMRLYDLLAAAGERRR